METPKTVCSGTTFAQPPQTSQITHLKRLHHCPFLELTRNAIAQKPWQEPSPRETTDNVQFRGLLTFLSICKILLFFPGAAYPAAHHWRVTNCGGTWSRHLWSCPRSQHTGRHPPRNPNVSILPELTHSVSAVTSVLVILGKTAPSPHRFLPVMRQGMLLHQSLMPPEQVPEHWQKSFIQKEKNSSPNWHTFSGFSAPTLKVKAMVRFRSFMVSFKTGKPSHHTSVKEIFRRNLFFTKWNYFVEGDSSLLVIRVARIYCHSRVSLGSQSLGSVLRSHWTEVSSLNNGIQQTDNL